MAAPAASAPAAAAPAAAASVPATPTFKVFVGNLSFKTREGELQKAFSGAGNVYASLLLQQHSAQNLETPMSKLLHCCVAYSRFSLSANIITRGPRSLGYGFVEFATEAEANKSVALMNKKELDGREINVEVAKNREDAPAPAGGEGGFRGRGRGGGAQRGGFLRRRGGPAAGGAPAAAGGGAPAAAGGADGGHPRGRGGFRGGRGGRGGAAAAAGGAAPAAAGAGAPRPPRVEAAPAAPRTQSATTLFVANLPFAVDDKGLQEIFQGFNPSAAHVVTKRNGRSKGFGFVEFKNAEDQQKALAAVEKKQVQGRELIVKIALTDQVHHEGGAAAPAAAAAVVAAAAAAPAAAAEKK